MSKRVFKLVAEDPSGSPYLWTFQYWLYGFAAYRLMAPRRPQPLACKCNQFKNSMTRMGCCHDSVLISTRPTLGRDVQPRHAEEIVPGAPQIDSGMGMDHDHLVILVKLNQRRRTRKMIARPTEGDLLRAAFLLWLGWEAPAGNGCWGHGLPASDLLNPPGPPPPAHAMCALR